jgi:hypothetical protein
VDAEEGNEEEGGCCCLKIQTLVDRVVGMIDIDVQVTLNGSPDRSTCLVGWSSAWVLRLFTHFIHLSAKFLP